MSLTLVSCDQALSLRVSLQRTVSGHTVQALQQLRLSLLTRRSTGALFDPPQTANLAPWCQGHQAEVDFSC